MIVGPGRAVMGAGRLDGLTVSRRGRERRSGEVRGNADATAAHAAAVLVDGARKAGDRE
jgi:hypothetical protein